MWKMLSILAAVSLLTLVGCAANEVLLSVRFDGELVGNIPNFDQEVGTSQGE